jgi:hypothetical protein
MTNQSVDRHRRYPIKSTRWSSRRRPKECAWWRGTAYGVVADVPAISLNLDDRKVLVDLYANAEGTLQWVVLVTGEQQ